jgi:hypothetical protein
MAAGGENADGRLVSPATDRPSEILPLVRHPARAGPGALEISDETMTELAAEYGVGGAVRIVSWSQADPDRMAELRAMRDGDGSEGSGMGWGQIAKELGVHPGLGSIMGQGGDHKNSDEPGEDH